jgi:hypothetical protein
MVALIGSKVRPHGSALEEQSVAGGAPLLEERFASVGITRAFLENFFDLPNPLDARWHPAIDAGVQPPRPE